MKITIIVDKIDSAIYKLALPIKKYNSHLQVEICDLHPKRPSKEQMKRVLTHIQDSDIIDIHYWRSGELIKDFIKDKKKVLFHFNPYDLRKQQWNYDEVVVGNEEMRTILPLAKLIPFGIDLDFFEFCPTYTNKKTVLMVANRIESEKGILEVARACYELGYIFYLVGSISDAQYMAEIMKYKPIFYENISNEDLRNVYYNSAILVCNSKDNFESGTLPILEAMACRVPVLTRIIGHVPDLYNGNNLMLLEGGREDINLIKLRLKEFMEGDLLRNEMRNRAWNSIRGRYDKKMARQISNLYYRMLNNIFVSIIIPTYNNPSVLYESLSAAINQTYPYKEIIIVDNGDYQVEELIKKAREITKTPIKYLYFNNNNEWALAKARNLGVVEAQGNFLLFCDERIKMDKNACQSFVNRAMPNSWLYGIKDDTKKGFIENFSFIKREELIRYGLFNERINTYGGLSDELRRRFSINGFMFELIFSAKATQLKKSSSKFNKKKEIIQSKLQIFKLYA